MSDEFVSQAVFIDMLRKYERRFTELENQINNIVIGTGRYVVEKNFVTLAIADNVATDVFRIETTNETGSTDAGGYAVYVHALIGHALSSTATNTAVKSFTAHYARAMEDAGTGVNSVVSEISETASVATSGAARDIGTVTMTVVENSEYQNDIQFTIDLSGAATATAQVICFVRVLWYGFSTAPVLTQL